MKKCSFLITDTVYLIQSMVGYTLLLLLLVYYYVMSQESGLLWLQGLSWLTVVLPLLHPKRTDHQILATRYASLLLVLALLIEVGIGLPTLANSLFLLIIALLPASAYLTLART